MSILIITCLLVAIFALVAVVFYDEIQLKILPFFLDYAAHHYFILAFIVIMVIMLIIRVSLKKKEQKIIVNSLDNENPFLYLSSSIHNREIEKIVFSELDVLEDNEAKNRRMKEILLSLRLGVLFRKKVTIFFKDFRRHLKISDLIIKKKEDKILLKGGGFIPIKSIYKIEISK